MREQKSFYPKGTNHDRNWVVIDAEGLILGRLASEISQYLRGKNEVNFTPSVDLGNFVVVYNVEKIKVTGKKLNDKNYYRHSGFPGGLKVTSLQKVLDEFPERVLLSAVKGMLPKNRLGRQLLTKLKLYKGNTHPHDAQSPQDITSFLREEITYAK